MREVPIPSSPKALVDIRMEGRRVGIRVKYENASNTWTLDLLDRSSGSDGTELILSGIAIVVESDLLGPHNLGLGGLIALATESPELDPGTGELGRRVKLYHLSEEEVAQA